jgi:hypothetical protein
MAGQHGAWLDAVRQTAKHCGDQRASGVSARTSRQPVSLIGAVDLAEVTCRRLTLAARIIAVGSKAVATGIQ